MSYKKDFQYVSCEIAKIIGKYKKVILCDYHLYLLPQKLIWKYVIYYWFIPILGINDYSNKDTIREIVYSLNFCDKIVFLNDVYLENFKKLFVYFFPNDIIKPELLVNTLWADEFFVNTKENIKETKTIRFWMISRLDPIKNILNTIRWYEAFLKEWDYDVSFEILANFHRQDSDFYKSYEEKVIRSINEFEFKDKINISFWEYEKEKVKRFYEEIDVFVCLSFYDWMPLTVLEFILANKNNYNKKLLLSKTIWSYNLLNNKSWVIWVNPFSIGEIKEWFKNVFINNDYINMEESFNVSKSTSLQNWEIENKNILSNNKIILLWSWDTLWTPVVWCNCEVCKTEKRTRFWIYINYEWKNILIDTNPDLNVFSSMLLLLIFLVNGER